MEQHGEQILGVFLGHRARVHRAHSLAENLFFVLHELRSTWESSRCPSCSSPLLHDFLVVPITPARRAAIRPGGKKGTPTLGIFSDKTVPKCSFLSVSFIVVREIMKGKTCLR